MLFILLLVLEICIYLFLFLFIFVWFWSIVIWYLDHDFYSYTIRGTEPWLYTPYIWYVQSLSSLPSTPLFSSLSPLICVIEIMHHASTIKAKVASFVVREELRSKMEEFLQSSNSTTPFIVYGEVSISPSILSSPSFLSKVYAS